MSGVLGFWGFGVLGQQDILIRELENIIQQLNFTYQQDLREELTARTWFLK